MRITENEIRFFTLLKNLFIGEKIEGDGAYVNLMKLKSKHFEEIEEKVQTKLYFKRNREEIYDKLYTFFHSFFDKSGGVMFANTPKWKNIYAKLDSQDTELFYKTKDLYYIKTQKVYNSMEIQLTVDFVFKFDVSELGERKGNEKRDIEFYFVNYKQDDVKHYLTFKVKYKEKQNYDVLKDILGIETKEIRKTLLNKDDAYIKVIKNFVYENKDKLKPDDIDLLIKEVGTDALIKKAKVEFVITKYKALKKFVPELKEEFFNKALTLYKQQSEIDYFIHKNTKAFLKEQFNLYMFRYINDEEVDFDKDRLEELKFLKEVADILIDEIALFENELKRIWIKPRFVFDSNYVITKDRLEKYGVLDKFLSHRGIEKQIKEWGELKLVEKEFELNNINDKKYNFLPFDTKHFKDIEIELLERIENLDDELDGRLIHSENFQALNTILPKYREKIDLIYIDPPFNTGSDFDYIDKFQDSTWLTLMENRLKLAYELLNKRGSFYLHLDYNANYMGRFLLNTIFGKDNFVNEIIWRKRAGGGNDSKFIANEHDNILFFAKNINFLKTNGFKRELAKYKYDNGYYLIKPLNDTSLQDSKGLHYDIKLPNGKILEGDKHQWKISKSTFDKYLQENKIIFKEKSVYYKHYIDIQKDLLPPSIFYNQGFNATGTRDLKELDLYNFSKNKPTSKPEKLLIKLIDIGSNENDFIIDFFMGFGSTISTAHKLKRKWLGVEMGEHFETIVLPRMKKVLAGVIVGISKELEKEKRLNKGGFFKYYSLEQYENILKKAEYKNNIKTSPLLGLKGIKIKENNAYYTFERIYPDKQIDLAETISNLLGEKIIKITKDKIYLESKEIELNDLTFKNYPELKSLIYWGESYA